MNIHWLSNAQVTSGNLCVYVSMTYENLKKVWREGVVMMQNRVERTSMMKILQTTSNCIDLPPPLIMIH